MARISVVTPVLNGRRTLPALVSSLGEQGVGVQWVVVDDGSEDGTPEFLTGLALPQGVDLLLATSSRMGPGGARNVGLTKVEAPWVAFVDADDSLEPFALLRWLEVAEQFEADVLLTDQPSSIVGRMRMRLDGHARVLPPNEIWGGEALRPWTLHGKLFRRRALEGVEFPAASEAEDLAFYVAVMLRATRIVFAPGLPRSVYSEPARSALSLPIKDPVPTIETYAAALRGLAAAAPSAAALATGASPVLGGLSVTLVRSLWHASTTEETLDAQRAARAAFAAAGLRPRRFMQVYRRDRSLVLVGLMCASAPAPTARSIARVWVGLKNRLPARQ